MQITLFLTLCALTAPIQAIFARPVDKSQIGAVAAPNIHRTADGRLARRAILLSRHVFASTACACDVRIGNKKDSA
jgi:hypothetical protein